MASRSGAIDVFIVVETLSAQYQRVRDLSVALTETLEAEDFVVQTMPDVSPTKWHLAHITWFFERFVLCEHSPGYRVFDESFDFLFNSYYYTAGEMHARPKRGLLSRPTVREVLDYRQHVDEAMQALIAERDEDEKFRFLVTLGLNHEQQHQELLLTDIKHVFSVNPLLPAMNPKLEIPPSEVPEKADFVEQDGGIKMIGAEDGTGFCFDNETPRHKVLVNPHSLMNRLVTNGEYREFIRAGGYRTPELWLSDGWAVIQAEGWDRPLYWREDLCSEFTLGGLRDIDWHAPVSHVSYYEADAYASWARSRLPTESEWELAAIEQEVEGNLLEDDYWQPCGTSNPAKIKQLYGDVWEWTASSYTPYPGFKPLDGSLGEYNGKFMLNQMVVRGGSAVTSEDHVRASYRSFFYPDARWQFLGFRLARDL